MSAAPSSARSPTRSAVDTLNHELGTDRPRVVQYWRLDHRAFVHGDLGTVARLPGAGRPSARAALGNSIKLAPVAFLIVVPLAILGGIVAGLRVGQRRSTASSRSAGSRSPSCPEFVTGIVLILVFGVWLGWLPVTAQAPDGAGVLTQLEVSAPAGDLPRGASCSGTSRG